MSTTPVARDYTGFITDPSNCDNTIVYTVTDTIDTHTLIDYTASLYFKANVGILSFSIDPAADFRSYAPSVTQTYTVNAEIADRFDSKTGSTTLAVTF